MATRLIIFSLLVISVLSMPLKFQWLFSDILDKDLPNDNAISSNSETAIKILHAYGDLYEYKFNQTLHLLFNTPINPKYLHNITISTRNNSKYYYYIEKACFYENNYSNGNATNIACALDLSTIPKGDYLISYYLYEDILKVDKLTLLTIKESEEKKNKTENIELTGVYTPGVEHKRDQNISLFFKNNENVNISLINSILVYRNRTTYNLSLICLSKDKNNSVLCITDFTNLNSGAYEVILHVYNYTYINASNIINFYINEDKQIQDDIQLIGAYGEAYTKNYSLILLEFNKKVLLSDFNLFILRDNKTNYDYYLNYTKPAFYNSTSSLDLLFDFRNIPKGLYFIGFVYKNKKYISNITLNVKGNEEEIISENELLNIYHNFEGNKDNQIAYFSFYGKNMSNHLAYIVLSDDYSRINVLQTLDCISVVSDLNTYDLRCRLNLTYVSKGAYTVSEYYINNQHYNTKKKINVIVQ